MLQVSVYPWISSTSPCCQRWPELGVGSWGPPFVSQGGRQRAEFLGDRLRIPWQRRGGLKEFISRLGTPADPACSLRVFLSPACLCQPRSQPCLLFLVALRNSSEVKVLRLKHSSSGCWGLGKQARGGFESRPGQGNEAECWSRHVCWDICPSALQRSHLSWL